MVVGRAVWLRHNLVGYCGGDLGRVLEGQRGTLELVWVTLQLGAALAIWAVQQFLLFFRLQARSGVNGLEVSLGLGCRAQWACGLGYKLMTFFVFFCFVFFFWYSDLQNFLFILQLSSHHVF